MGWQPAGRVRARSRLRSRLRDQLGDAPKAIHLPDGGRMDGMGGGCWCGHTPAGAELSALRPPPACAAFNFSYAELERAPQGPFGVIPSEHMSLHTAGES